MSPQSANGNSSQAEIAARRPATSQESAPATGSDAYRFDLIACDGCGRCFTTLDGPGMIAAIKGACPDCGGRFELTSP